MTEDEKNYCRVAAVGLGVGLDLIKQGQHLLRHGRNLEGYHEIEKARELLEHSAHLNMLVFDKRPTEPTKPSKEGVVTWLTSIARRT